MPRFVPLFNERGQQFEGVVHLVFEEHFLLRRPVCLHVVENELESLVGYLLAFELPQLHGSNLLEHGGVARNEVTRTLTSIDVSLRNAADSIETPCSVNTRGI